MKTVNCPLVLSTCRNWELLFTRPHRPLWFKKIRTITTTAILISNTVVPNPYTHSIAFNGQFFSQLSELPGPIKRFVLAWYSILYGLEIGNGILQCVNKSWNGIFKNKFVVHGLYISFNAPFLISTYQKW